MEWFNIINETWGTHNKPDDIQENLPKTIDNLQDIINDAMRKDGQFIPITWIKLIQLPNAQRELLLKLAPYIFKECTSIRFTQILTTSSMIIPRANAVKLIEWIRKDGKRIPHQNFDFSNIIPGYTAKEQLWEKEGYSFLLVKDDQGYYIYGWPI